MLVCIAKCISRTTTSTTVHVRHRDVEHHRGCNVTKAPHRQAERGGQRRTPPTSCFHPPFASSSDTSARIKRSLVSAQHDCHPCDDQRCVKHYLRYAIISRTRGNPPQKEWRISIDEAESQMARFTEETEGSITAVIRSLEVGSLVALDWLEVAERFNDHERIERPCQKLECISTATEEQLLMAHPKV